MKKTRIMMLIMKVVVTVMLTILVIYNLFKGELLWAIIFMQLEMMYNYTDDKREKLADEYFETEFKHLMIQSQTRVMNAVKALVERDIDHAKKVVGAEEPKRRGRKPKSE